ncbi:MAG: hypothetical protein BZ136_00860 [Methanosphaera sp. rholeuAM74]|nr:MAG: hypothetical protein BZ136_00860 [Methanosphaera sp. rholeuAM74]
MAKSKFMSSYMDVLKNDYPELYKMLVQMNDEVYNPEVLDEKTLKLVAVALVAGTNDGTSIKMQMQNAINEYGITKDEIMDVLRMVLLINGKPAFTKSVGILSSL